MTAYTATTTNASNKVTVTPESGATVAITVNGSPVENGASATWAPGENIVRIVASKDGAQNVYTVVVTK